ncbi:MAG: hypothetical protein KKF48_02750 [Nanoarchaeota archaeon]|nr:hypothetical protein [Nanoarchaeota archaeon]
MINSIRLQITDFLNIIIFQNSFFFLNFWSVVHLLFGVGIMYILIKKEVRCKFLFLFSLFSLWELFEFFMIGMGSSLFLREFSIDVFYDIVYGMLGGFVISKRIGKK